MNTLAVLAIATTATGCGDDDSGSASAVTTELLSLSGAASGVSLHNGLVSGISSDDVVIDSYKMVVSDIAISPGTELTGSNSSPVYACSGDSDEDCLIDLATAGALENLLTGDNTHDVDSGTYTFATVGTCMDNTASRDDQGSYVYVKARGLINGTWHYTTDATGVTTTALVDLGSPTWPSTEPSDYGTARKFVSGCRSYNVFQNPIKISEGEKVTLKLFFELRDMVNIQREDGTPPGMCYEGTATAATTDFIVCSQYAYLAGTIEKDTPELHRYRITTTDGSNISKNVFGIYFKAGTTTPVGAFNYPYFDSAVNSQSEFDQVIKSVAAVDSDTLKVVTYGGSTSTDEIDTLPGDFNTEEFPILSTVGASATLSWEDESGNAKSSTIERISN